MVIQQSMKARQDSQKAYAEWRRKPLEFREGDKVFLKASPIKGLWRFKVKGKLSPCFIGPCDIIKKTNPVAHRLALPPELQHAHDVLHISQLRKYMPDPMHAIVYQPLKVET